MGGTLGLSSSCSSSVTVVEDFNLHLVKKKSLNNSLKSVVKTRHKTAFLKQFLADWGENSISEALVNLVLTRQRP